LVMTNGGIERRCLELILDLPNDDRGADKCWG